MSGRQDKQHHEDLNLGSGSASHQHWASGQSTMTPKSFYSEKQKHLESKNALCLLPSQGGGHKKAHALFLPRAVPTPPQAFLSLQRQKNDLVRWLRAGVPSMLYFIIERFNLHLHRHRDPTCRTARCLCPLSLPPSGDHVFSFSFLHDSVFSPKFHLESQRKVVLQSWVDLRLWSDSQELPSAHWPSFDPLAHSLAQRFPCIIQASSRQEPGEWR